MLAAAPLLVSAQIERLTEQERQRYLGQLPALVDQTRNASLKTHLQGLSKPATAVALQSAVNAVRVASDVTNLPSTAVFVHYAVPAMSEVQRLTDLYPMDGEANAPV